MTCWLLQNTLFFTGKRLLWPGRGSVSFPVIARFLMVAWKGFHHLLLGAVDLVCHQRILRIFLVMLMGQVLMVLVVLVLVMLLLLGELPQSFCLPKGASHAEDRHQDWDWHYTLLATHVSIAHWHLHVDSSRLYAGHRENLPSIGLRQIPGFWNGTDSTVVLRHPT